MLGWQSHHAWTQGFWGGGEDQTQALYLVGELSVVRLDSSSLCLLVFDFFFKDGPILYSAGVTGMHHQSGFNLFYFL